MALACSDKNAFWISGEKASALAELCRILGTPLHEFEVDDLSEDDHLRDCIMAVDNVWGGITCGLCMAYTGRPHYGVGVANDKKTRLRLAHLALAVSLAQAGHGASQLTGVLSAYEMMDDPGAIGLADIHREDNTELTYNTRVSFGADCTTLVVAGDAAPGRAPQPRPRTHHGPPSG